MIKLKNIISNILFIFLVSTQLPGYAGWGWFEKEATIIGDKAADAAKAAAQVAERIAQTSGIQMSNQFGTDAATKIAEMGEKFAPAADKIANAAQGAVCIGAAIQTVYLIKDIASTVYPNETEKKNRELAQQEYEYLIKRKELKACLISNRGEHKTPSGRPSACEQTAQLFAMAAGNDKELNELTTVFKKYFR